MRGVGVGVEGWANLAAQRSTWDLAWHFARKRRILVTPASTVVQAMQPSVRGYKVYISQEQYRDVTSRTAHNHK